MDLKDLGGREECLRPDLHDKCPYGGTWSVHDGWGECSKPSFTKYKVCKSTPCLFSLDLKIDRFIDYIVDLELGNKERTIKKEDL